MTEQNTPRSGKSGGRVATVRGKGIADGAKLEIEIMHYWNGTANAGDVCKYCLIDALRELDDRPQPACRPA